MAQCAIRTISFVRSTSIRLVQRHLEASRYSSKVDCLTIRVWVLVRDKGPDGIGSVGFVAIGRARKDHRQLEEGQNSQRPAYRKERRLFTSVWNIKAVPSGGKSLTRWSWVNG